MKVINYQDLCFNPMTMIAEDWMIVCAGNQTDGFNGMTVSWGHFGSIWGHQNGHNLPTILVYVRPSRFTLEFMKKEEYFSVNVLPKNLKKVHAVFGAKSGRNIDKFQETGLTAEFDDRTVFINESKYVFVCRKLYTDEFKENHFHIKEVLEETYPARDFHHFFIGEIVKVYASKEESNA